MKNILVSGASGIVGYGILRSLRMSGKDNRLIGTSIFEDTIAEAFCDLFVKAVPTDDEGYIDWLVQVIEKHDVGLIVPGIEIDMKVWNENRHALERAGARLLLNESGLIRLCADKWDFYRYMKENDLPYVIRSSLDRDYEKLTGSLGRSLLIKPRVGYGSRGIVKVDSQEVFERYKAEIGENCLVQEFVGTDEEEYSCSAFGDGEGGLFGMLSLQRFLSKDGYTERATVVEDADLQVAVGRLVEHFKPVGPTNFQFRRCQAGGLKLLEINPRISSSTSIRSAFGYNEPAMSVDYFLHGRRPESPAIRKGRAIRYTEDYIAYE